jgi:preprotein translocase subunit SecE
LAGSSSLSTRALKKGMNKVIEYIKASFDEMKNKVTWPTYGELQISSVLVLVASLIFALFIGAIDFVFDKGMTYFYQSF